MTEHEAARLFPRQLGFFLTEDHTYEVGVMTDKDRKAMFEAGLLREVALGRMELTETGRAARRIVKGGA